MTNLPAPNHPGRTDVPAIPTSPFSEPWLNSLRRGLGKVGNRPTLMAGFAMTPAERQAIDRKLSTYRRAITGGPDDAPAVGVELAKLLAAFPAQDASASAALRIEAYRDAIGWAPAWAVHAARLRFIRGEVAGHDGRWCPTPPHIAAAIRDILRSLEADLADLTALASIAPSHEPTAEERARVAAMVDGFRAEMRGRPVNPRASARSALEERARSLGLDPDEALASIPDAKPRGDADRLAPSPELLATLGDRAADAA